MRKIKVLHIINGMGSGGAEMVIMNWYRHINRERYQFDFLLRTKTNIYKNEIEEYGGNIYYTSTFPKHWNKNYKETEEFFVQHKYDVVHIHANALIYMKAAIEAKKHNKPIIIMHSHSTKTAKKIYLPLHKLNMFRLDKYVNIKLACSEKAGKWMFGKEKYQIIENAVDTKIFNYYPKQREELRQQYGVTDSFVVGHVGRFLPSKNHLFLIDIFVEILKIKQNAVLLLIGEGSEKKNIEDKVKKIGIDNKVRFLGVRADVAQIEQLMDVFVFPSRFEGLPVALIEAQFTHLPCIVSSNISREVQLNNAIKFYPIENSAKDWALETIELVNQCEREKVLFNTNSQKYHIEKIINDLEQVYLQSNRI